VKRIVSSFGAGALFGLGLVLSGMTQPVKVFGFLNVTEAWDPSLALVMGGALLIYVLGYAAVTSWDAPLLAKDFAVPARRDLSRDLVVGSALFGAGWAISGFCPGPALVALGSGMDEALLFVPAMLGGMLLHRFTLGRNTPPAHGGDA
jgi:uncharacterized membrane protein YedE/YeeE